MRGQLQKALTVEWDGGHKTVLVDLAPRDDDVEMAGFSSLPPSKAAGYGRLADGDEGEDEEALFAAWDEGAREREREARTRNREMVKETVGSKHRTALDEYDELERRTMDLARRKAPPPRLDPQSLDASPQQRREFRSNNPFAAPFSRADEAAAMPRLYDQAGHDAWMWDAQSADPSPTSSIGSGASSGAMARPKGCF